MPRERQRQPPRVTPSSDDAAFDTLKPSRLSVLLSTRGSAGYDAAGEDQQASRGPRASRHQEVAGVVGRSSGMCGRWVFWPPAV